MSDRTEDRWAELRDWCGPGPVGALGIEVAALLAERDALAAERPPTDAFTEGDRVLMPNGQEGDIGSINREPSAWVSWGPSPAQGAHVELRRLVRVVPQEAP